MLSILLHVFVAFKIGFSALIVSCNLLTLAHGSIVSSQFPKNFLFGTASSSYQFEGAYLSDGKGLSNWDVFTHKPGRILDGSNGDVAVDHYYRYMEDIDLMKDMGVNSYRFSISWARILPKGRFGRVNGAGINHYNNVINALLRKGILPFVTLTHYDIPQELEERYGGWLNPEVQEDFRYYADICFRSFGDRVKYWATFNEPNVAAIFGYQSGTHPPSRCSQPFGNCTSGNSEKEPFIAAHNMILSHAAAANVYRAKYQGGNIGIVINAIWFEPISNSLVDRSAAERAMSFFMNWFLDPIISGNYPDEMHSILGSQLPSFSKDDMKNLKIGLDFIGVNHYTSYYVKDCIHSECATGPGVTKVEGLGLRTPLKNEVLIGQPASVDWEYMYPQGMEKIVTYLKERYKGIPMFITENGYGGQENRNSTSENSLNDTARVDYMSDYLDSLARTIREGADVRGYFAWSLLDNFEWTYGYNIRFGLHHVDYATLKRTPRLSATWYKQFIIDHVACQKSRSNCTSATS